MVFEKYKIALANPIDPPQPPLKRGEPDPIPPFLRGVRGDPLGCIGNKFNFSNTLLENQEI
jgi:hypothetical protein